MFTLQELMSIEEKRVEEERSALARLESERRAAAEQARKIALDEERAQLAAADERRRAQALADRAAEALATAQAAAIVEQARVTATAEARLKELALVQDHERAVAQLKANESRAGMRRGIVGLSIGLVLLVGGGLGLYFGKLRPDAITEAQRIEAQEAAARAEVDRLKSDNFRKDGLLSDAERRIEEERRAREAAANAANAKPTNETPEKPAPRVQGQPPVVPSIVTSSPRTVVPCVESDDPLDPCVNGHK